MMNVYYFHHQADELLGTASEQFLGKSVKEIKQTILQTLEGHLRAILGGYMCGGRVMKVFLVRDFLHVVAALVLTVSTSCGRLRGLAKKYIK